MENIPEIILSVKTGTVDPTAVTADFTGQLYLNENTDTLFFARSTTTGDYEELVDESSDAGGDMLKSVYDTDDNGIVDKSETLNDGSSGGGNEVTASEVRGHIDDTDNPHEVDKSDVGLGNVPNLDTTDAVNNQHVQNTDTKLDDGQANEVTSADLRSHLDDTNDPHDIQASQADTDTTNFDGILSPTEDTVQKALDKIDDISTGAGDMLKSVYDINDNEIVDKSETLNDGSSGGGNSTSASELRSHLDDPNAHDASEIDTDTTNFDRILSPADDTVQKALDTLDNQIADFHDDITIVFQPDQSHNFGDYRVHNISAAGNSNLSFRIPEDFLSLNSIRVYFIPANTIAVGKTINLNSDYASAGEISDIHSESSLGTSITGTANTIEFLDISGVFTNISGGDFCGLNWKNNTIGTTISILMIEMKYNQVP